jgi:hypothetical protein
MKRTFILLVIFLILIAPVAAQNVTIHDVTFEIPHQYEGGTLKSSSYVYQSGLTFRILGLEDAKNLRINFGDDLVEASSHEETQIEGHDAVVIHRNYNGKDYTCLYTPVGDEIFLICFNDTRVNDDISGMISKLPAQNMTHDEFSDALNTALSDYQDQLSQENADIQAEEYYRSNQPTNRFFFFRF